MDKKTKTINSSKTVGGWFDDFSIFNSPPGFASSTYTLKSCGGKAKVKKKSTSKKPSKPPKALTEKMMIDTFKAFSEGFVVTHPKIPSSKEMVAIGAKIIYAPKEKKKAHKTLRIFKMSDFKFPSVKRINTQLAQKTLKVDLGEDILEDIGGLKI